MLTREQINEFAAFADRIHEMPSALFGSLFAHHGLVTVSVSEPHYRLTPRGHDLLATIPHLPPEPEPVAAAPSCARCNGETTVPLFMGPMSGGATMPCPACANDDGSPQAAADHVAPVAESAPAKGPVWYMHRSEHDRDLIIVPSASSVRIGDRVRVNHLTEDNEVVVAEIVSKSRHGVGVRVRPISEPSDDWTLIDSEETARSFVGATVEVDAQAVTTADDCTEEHRLHGGTTFIARANGPFVYARSATDGIEPISWRSRGNVRLRRVAP
jgi:hypothetical protein